MKVTLINKSDLRGGAAVVTFRLMEALRTEGIDARMVVAEKLSDSPHVALAASPAALRRPFLAERLRIFLANGLNRRDLFKADTGLYGAPLWKHPWVSEADVVCLNWVNQGLLSFDGIRRIHAAGKSIVWTMHDMWNATAICHHAGECDRFRRQCGFCPLLGRFTGRHDLSLRVHQAKERLYSEVPVRFVAVSRWLKERCMESSLLRGRPVEVIPNAFPIEGITLEPVREPGKRRIVFGAARIDDPIKGLPILQEALKVLAERYPEWRDQTELVTFGSVKDPAALQDFAIAHRHLGTLPPAEVMRLYAGASAVVSTSLFETLPGTLVEGQACGAVPVAFRRGGQPDIVDHLRTGYLADFNADPRKAGEAIAAGIDWALHNDNEEIRREMLASVRSRFDSRAVARRYLALFRSLT